MIFAVLGELENLLSPTTPEQDKLSTPCSAFDVATLRHHLFGWLAYFDAALADPTGDERPDPGLYTGPDDAAAVIGGLAATVRAALAGSAGATDVNVPRLGGTYPVDVVIDLLLIEAIGHGWDLARALDRPWQPGTATCEHALTVLRGMVRPEFRGPGLPFGAEVRVDPGAPALDRLVAFTGRDPGWTPPA